MKLSSAPAVPVLKKDVHTHSIADFNTVDSKFILRFCTPVGYVHH
jgi:hypothetical protein